MKRIIFSLITACAITLLVWFNLNYFKEEITEGDDLSRILDEIWDEYDILAYSVLTTDSVLYFVIDDTEDKDEVAHTIEKKLEHHDIKEYSLEIHKDYEVAVE